MKFTEEKIKTINDKLWKKKEEKPIHGHIVGIGINLADSIHGAEVFKDNWHICTLEELNRIIEELSMLKESIEEETGVIL